MDFRNPDAVAVHASPLIQVDELAGLLAGPEPVRHVVLDVRYRMGTSTGLQEFEEGHVPGASYVVMDTELATIRADGAGGRHPMPTRDLRCCDEIRWRDHVASGGRLWRLDATAG
jgi:3-mercaptopyruvate sulfurtransferase SseA